MEGLGLLFESKKSFVRESLIKHVNQMVLEGIPCGEDIAPFHILDLAFMVWSCLSLRNPVIHPSPLWGWAESPFVAERIVLYAERAHKYPHRYDGGLKRLLVPHVRYPASLNGRHQEWLCDGKRFIYEFHGCYGEKARTKTGFSFIFHQT